MCSLVSKTDVSCFLSVDTQKISFNCLRIVHCSRRVTRKLQTEIEIGRVLSDKSENTRNYRCGRRTRMFNLRLGVKLYVCVRARMCVCVNE